MGVKKKKEASDEAGDRKASVREKEAQGSHQHKSAECRLQRHVCIHASIVDLNYQAL